MSADSKTPKNAPTPEQMRALAEQVENYWPPRAEVQAALRAAADQLEAVQMLLAEAHDKFAATYDAERMVDRGPSSIGVAGAPLASSVQRALDLLRAKATANIERLTADTAPQENSMSKCDWPECPGQPKSVEKHEIESGPEVHPQCKDAILLAERARREGWHTAPQEDSAAEKLRLIATTYDVDKMLRAIKAGE